jgi:hypothetical protein
MEVAHVMSRSQSSRWCVTTPDRLRALVGEGGGRWDLSRAEGVPMRRASRDAVPGAKGSPRDPADSRNDPHVEGRTEQ